MILQITKIVRRSEKIESREYVLPSSIMYIYRSEVTKNIEWVMAYINDSSRVCISYCLTIL